MFCPSKALHPTQRPTCDTPLTKIINYPRGPPAYRARTECFMHYESPLMQTLLSSLYYRQCSRRAERGNDSSKLSRCRTSKRWFVGPAAFTEGQTLFGILCSILCLYFKMDVDYLEDIRHPEVMSHGTCLQVEEGRV